MNFYVTLPSNSSMDLYPNNTLSNYTIQLKKTIKFDVPYEVALVEMIYSYRIQHEVGTIIIRDGPITDGSSYKFAKIFYKDGQNYVSFIKSIENQIVEQLALYEYIVDAKKKIADNLNKTTKQIVDDNPNTATEDSKKKITDNSNKTTKQIVDDIPAPDDFEFKNTVYLKKLKTKIRKYIPKFSIDLVQNILSVKNNGSIVYTIVGDILISLLGNHYESVNTVDKYYVSDMTKPSFLNAFFVYTDIVQHQIVGDTVAPLLANVALKGNYGDVISANFDNPHYKPVCMNELYSISIEIKDDFGSKILFEDGKLITKLHFRPIKYGY